VPGCEVHVQAEELKAALAGSDEAYFLDDFAQAKFTIQRGEYTLAPGIRAVSTPGHTAGHMSLLVELASGPPILLCGDAADLHENLEYDVAPGLCWEEREDLALASIRKLKAVARETGAQLWPNHDLAFRAGTMAARDWHQPSAGPNGPCLIRHIPFVPPGGYIAVSGGSEPSPPPNKTNNRPG
jgi:N-acyl homoserine lactone hydrolase